MLSKNSSVSIGTPRAARCRSWESRARSGCGSGGSAAAATGREAVDERPGSRIPASARPAPAARPAGRGDAVRQASAARRRGSSSTGRTKGARQAPGQRPARRRGRGGVSTRNRNFGLARISRSACSMPASKVLPSARPPDRAPSEGRGRRRSPAAGRRAGPDREDRPCARGFLRGRRACGERSRTAGEDPPRLGVLPGPVELNGPVIVT